MGSRRMALKLASETLAGPTADAVLAGLTINGKLWAAVLDARFYPMRSDGVDDHAPHGMPVLARRATERIKADRSTPMRWSNGGLTHDHTHQL